MFLLHSLNSYSQLHLNNTYSASLKYSNFPITSEIGGNYIGVDVTMNYQFSEFVAGFDYSGKKISGKRIVNNLNNSTANGESYVLYLGYGKYLTSFQVYKMLGIAFWGRGSAFGGYDIYEANFNDDALKINTNNGWLYGVNLSLMTEITMSRRFSVLVEYGKNIHIDNLTGIIKDRYSLGMRYYIYNY